MESKIQGSIDSPLTNQEIGPGFMLVKGWAFNSSGDDLKITIHIDGNLVGTAHYGLPRFDIFQKYQTEESYESGFIARIPVANLKEGTHKLSIFVELNSNLPISEISFKKTKKKLSPFVPPLAAGQIGEFRKAGEEYLGYCKTLANLKPNEKILEVGCGMGRFAHVFSKYLDKQGSYEAIDTMPQVIEFCKNNISKRYINFHFHLIDVFNDEYNKKGNFDASTYKFPFEENTFDLVFLHSVFTHLIPKDMENYLKEVSRVLKKGGRCLITFVLYSDERLQLISSNNYNFPYIHKFENYRLVNSKKPENAIAYDETFIRKLYEKYNLLIQEPIQYTPFNKKGNRKRQDFIIATKN